MNFLNVNPSPVYDFLTPRGEYLFDSNIDDNANSQLVYNLEYDKKTSQISQSNQLSLSTRDNTQPTINSINHVDEMENKDVHFHNDEEKVNDSRMDDRISETIHLNNENNQVE